MKMVEHLTTNPDIEGWNAVRHDLAQSNFTGPASGRNSSLHPASCSSASSRWKFHNLLRALFTVVAKKLSFFNRLFCYGRKLRAKMWMKCYSDVHGFFPTAPTHNRCQCYETFSSLLTLQYTWEKGRKSRRTNEGRLTAALFRLNTVQECCVVQTALARKY